MSNEENLLPEAAATLQAGTLGSEKYEITFLVSEDNSLKDCVKTLEENSAKIIKETDLGVKKLAYPIGKTITARFGAVLFEIEKTGLPKLEKALRLNKSIVRYLIIKEPPVAKPKPVKVKPAVKAEEPAVAPTADKTKEENIVKAAEPEKPKVEIKQPEKKTEEVKAKPEKEDKPKKRIVKKPVKVTADELEKKLKELTLD